MSQTLGAQIKRQSHDGIAYHSVRISGINFALFKPNVISKCQQASHYGYSWDGSKIAAVYEKKLFVLHAFVKKTQQTPKKAIDTALNRLKEVNLND